jgi:uncharacterized membrane protein
MTRAEMKAAAKAQIKGNVGIMFVITLLTGLISGTGIGSLLVPGISLSLCMIYLNMTKGQKANVGDMFSGIRYLGKAWWLNILIAFFTTLWTYLFVIPGIVKSFSYSMATYVLADNPNLTARQALNESKRIMKGHKWELFVLQLSFIGWHILGGLTFGLAYIYIIPYMSATTANFYNSIKDGVIVEG